MADLGPEGTSERRHAVDLLALGRAVASGGSLGEELLERASLVVQAMAVKARAAGAERLGLVATEALRQALDAPLLQERVAQLTGERLNILSGEMEARLSYLGATAFRVRSQQPCLVADVGGGSCEVVTGRGTQAGKGRSLKLGSDRLLLAISADDPPNARQLAEARARVSMVLERAPEPLGAGPLIATGGTAANLPVLLGRRLPHSEASPGLLEEPSGPAWTRVERAQLERAAWLCARHPSADLARRTGLSPARARLMAGGVMILEGLLERYRAPSLEVTERGLRDGVVLALAGVPANATAQEPA